jgi:hypothetical protein
MNTFISIVILSSMIFYTILPIGIVVPKDHQKGFASSAPISANYLIKVIISVAIALFVCLILKHYQYIID